MSEPQAPVRTRQRLALQSGVARAPSTGVGPAIGGRTRPGWGKRGEEADAAAAEAQKVRDAQMAERAAMRRQPRRFNLRQGQSADVILLDTDFGFQISEHEKWDDEQKRYVYESCPSEWEHCCLCEDAKLGRSSKYGFRTKTVVDMLTCIDLTPFEVTNGRDRGKVIQASRRLLPVKVNDRDAYKKLQQEHGSLRGIHILLERGHSEEESRIGRIEEYIATFSEEDLNDEPLLQDQMGEYVDDQGFLIREAGELIKPFDWEALFPAPDGAALLRKYGAAPPPGSRMANRLASNTDEWGDLSPGSARREQPRLPMGGGEDRRAPQTTPEGAGRTRLQRRAAPAASRSSEYGEPDEGRFAPPADAPGNAMGLDDDIPF